MSRYQRDERSLWKGLPFQWGYGLSEAATKNRLIHERGGVTFEDAFRQRFGPSCLEAWISKAGTYSRKAKPQPGRAHRLIFALLEGITFKYWDQNYDGRMVEGANYPPLDEIKELMIEHKEEIQSTNVTLPSYLGWLKGDYHFVLEK